MLSPSSQLTTVRREKKSKRPAASNPSSHCRESTNSRPGSHAKMQQLLYQSVRSVLQHARRSCFRAAFGHSSCSLRMRGATPESTWPQRSRASLRSPSRRSKEETMQAANRKGPPRCQTHPHKPRLQMLARSFRSSHCSMASREQMLRRKPQVLSLRLQSLIRTERPLLRRTA